MTIDDVVDKGYHKFTMKDLNYETPYREIPLASKLSDLTGIPGVKDAVDDYTKNYYRSLIKDHSPGKAVGNWALQWGAAAASFGYAYLPTKEFLSNSISNIVGSFGGGYGVLGGSLASVSAGALSSILLGVGGIALMDLGYKRHNPVLVGAGAAWAFGTATVGYDLFPYFASLLAPVTAAPIYPIIASILAFGVAYKAAKRLARPLVRWILGDETHKEPEKKQAPIYNLPDNKPAPSHSYQKAA